MKKILSLCVIFLFICNFAYADPGIRDSYRNALRNVKYDYIPAKNNDVDIGSQDKRVKKIWGVDGDFQGTVNITTSQTLDDDVPLTFGTDEDVDFVWETADADANYLNIALQSVSRNLIISEDVDIDWGHATQTNPTLWIQSANETDTTQYIAIYHDQTDPRIISGKGVISIGTGSHTQLNDTEDLYVSDDLEVAGILYTIKQTGVTPGSVRNIDAGTGITASNVRRQLLVRGNGGNVTVTAVPSIAAGVNGELMTLIGWDDAQTLTFQDAGNLAGSRLQLQGGVDITLGEYDTITLVYLQAKAAWVEIARSDN